MNIWEAHTKGGPNRDSFEICVIRKDFEHGHLSYGWFGDEKLLVSHNGGPCRWGVSQLIWDRLLGVAEEVADKLNSKERSSAAKK